MHKKLSNHALKYVLKRSNKTLVHLIYTIYLKIWTIKKIALANFGISKIKILKISL